MDVSKNDYSVLDRPEVCMFLFHPRKEPAFTVPESVGRDVTIPVEEEVGVGGRFHMADRSAPNILFFHGNGEIANDYDDLGLIYNRMNVNFMPVDYRGYGRSTGRPTVTAMMRDCHAIFDFVKKWLPENGYTGPLAVMGRSLGSASAVELAANYRDDIDGLIIESGFAYASPLLRILGINPDTLGFREEQGFRNTEKISEFDKPALVIHAEFDHIIPFSDGQTLFDSCGSADKTLLKVDGANHNDIFFKGMKEYLEAMQTLIGKLKKS